MTLKANPYADAKRGTNLDRVLKKIVIVTLMFVAAIISFLISSFQSDALIIWLPAGLSTWFFIIYGGRQFPFIIGAIVLAMLLHVNLTDSEVALQNHHSVGYLSALLISPAGAYWVACLLRKVLDRDGIKLDAVKSRFQFAGVMLIGFSVACILPALVMFAGFGMSAPDAIELGLRNWFAQFLGIVVFAPLFFDRYLRRRLKTLEKKRQLSEYFGIYAIPIAIFASSVFAWNATNASIEENIKSQFSAIVTENEDALKSRLASYVSAVLGSAGLFYASSAVSRAEWRAYVSALRIEENFPGINGLGYIANVNANNIEKYVAVQRQSGVPDFDSHPVVDHDDYYVITYIEPVAVNMQAVGLNIAFEKNRKEAADLSATTGRSAITGRILLVQDSEQTPGFLLLYPVYKTQLPSLTQAQRRDQLLGWVYAPFIGKNLLEGLTIAQGEMFHVQIFAGIDADPEKLIYSSAAQNPQPVEHRSALKRQKTIEVLQKKWTLVWSSTANFQPFSNNYQPEFILAGGAFISCLLGLFLATMTNSAASVRAEVSRKTAQIADARNGLQAVLDTVVDGVVQVSNDRKIVGFSPSAERIFGYTAQEVIGQTVDILLPEAVRSKYDLDLRNLVDTDIENIIGIGRTISAMRKDGTIFPMELGVNKIVLNGEIGFVGSVRDITERVAAQKALEQGERNFIQTLENAPIAALSVSPERELIHMNQAAKAMLGYTQQELEKSSVILAHPDDLNIDADQLAELMNGTKESFTIEKRLITKSGETIWVDQHVSLVRLPDGSPKYFIKQMINLTERKKTENIKNEFIATVSHELRTPITSISGALGLILGAMSEGLPDKVSGLLKVAHENSERLIALVNDILDMEKLGSGQTQYDLNDFKVDQLIEHAVAANNSFASKHNVELVVSPSNENFEIYVDDLRINQVLTNFISNACKFSPSGSQVIIETKRIGKLGRISVCDNGVGISDEFRSRIFNKFAQADSSATRQKGGTGLGLMISKQIVEQMGGNIGFDSVPNMETKFWVEFELFS